MQTNSDCWQLLGGVYEGGSRGKPQSSEELIAELQALQDAGD
jgi:hypothetical protein